MCGPANGLSPQPNWIGRRSRWCSAGSIDSSAVAVAPAFAPGCGSSAVAAKSGCMVSATEGVVVTLWASETGNPAIQRMARAAIDAEAIRVRFMICSRLSTTIYPSEDPQVRAFSQIRTSIRVYHECPFRCEKNHIATLSRIMSALVVSRLRIR